ncbi:hypothetical protein, partial [Nocardia farcinica]|uniref:hypothetical protein n=1 Tax=Nocardia farcinica TaxID=37329 RepID=UPI002458D31E
MTVPTGHPPYRFAWDPDVAVLVAAIESHRAGARCATAAWGPAPAPNTTSGLTNIASCGAPLALTETCSHAPHRSTSEAPARGASR